MDSNGSSRLSRLMAASVTAPTPTPTVTAAAGARNSNSVLVASNTATGMMAAASSAVVAAVPPLPSSILSAAAALPVKFTTATNTTTIAKTTVSNNNTAAAATTFPTDPFSLWSHFGGGDGTTVAQNNNKNPGAESSKKGGLGGQQQQQQQRRSIVRFCEQQQHHHHSPSSPPPQPQHDAASGATPSIAIDDNSTTSSPLTATATARAAKSSKELHNTTQSHGLTAAASAAAQRVVLRKTAPRTLINTGKEQQPSTTPPATTKAGAGIATATTPSHVAAAATGATHASGPVASQAHVASLPSHRPSMASSIGSLNEGGCVGDAADPAGSDPRTTPTTSQTHEAASGSSGAPASASNLMPMTTAPTRPPLTMLAVPEIIALRELYEACCSEDLHARPPPLMAAPSIAMGTGGGGGTITHTPGGGGNSGSGGADTGGMGVAAPMTAVVAGLATRSDGGTRFRPLTLDAYHVGLLLHRARICSVPPAAEIATIVQRARLWSESVTTMTTASSRRGSVEPLSTSAAAPMIASAAVEPPQLSFDQLLLVVELAKRWAKRSLEATDDCDDAFLNIAAHTQVIGQSKAFRSREGSDEEEDANEGTTRGGDQQNDHQHDGLPSTLTMPSNHNTSGKAAAGPSAGASYASRTSRRRQKVRIADLERVLKAVGMSYDFSTLFQGVDPHFDGRTVNPKMFRWAAGKEDPDIVKSFVALGGEASLSGTIPTDVLVTKCAAMNMTPQFIANFVAVVDANNDGVVDYGEFLSMILRNRHETVGPSAALKRTWSTKHNAHSHSAQQRRRRSRRASSAAGGGASGPTVEDNLLSFFALATPLSKPDESSCSSSEAGTPRQASLAPTNASSGFGGSFDSAATGDGAGGSTPQQHDSPEDSSTAAAAAAAEAAERAQSPLKPPSAAVKSSKGADGTDAAAAASGSQPLPFPRRRRFSHQAPSSMSPAGAALTASDFNAVDASDCVYEDVFDTTAEEQRLDDLAEANARAVAATMKNLHFDDEGFSSDRSSEVIAPARDPGTSSSEDEYGPGHNTGVGASSGMFGGSFFVAPGSPVGSMQRSPDGDGDELEDMNMTERRLMLRRHTTTAQAHHLRMGILSGLLSSDPNAAGGGARGSNAGGSEQGGGGAPGGIGGAVHHAPSASWSQAERIYGRARDQITAHRTRCHTAVERAQRGRRQSYILTDDGPFEVRDTATAARDRAKMRLERQMRRPVPMTCPRLFALPTHTIEEIEGAVRQSEATLAHMKAEAARAQSAQTAQRQAAEQQAVDAAALMIAAAAYLACGATADLHNTEGIAPTTVTTVTTAFAAAGGAAAVDTDELVPDDTDTHAMTGKAAREHTTTAAAKGDDGVDVGAPLPHALRSRPWSAGNTRRPLSGAAFGSAPPTIVASYRRSRPASAKQAPEKRKQQDMQQPQPQQIPAAPPSADEAGAHHHDDDEDRVEGPNKTTAAAFPQEPPSMMSTAAVTMIMPASPPRQQTQHHPSPLRQMVGSGAAAGGRPFGSTSPQRRYAANSSAAAATRRALNRIVSNHLSLRLPVADAAFLRSSGAVERALTEVQRLYATATPTETANMEEDVRGAGQEGESAHRVKPTPTPAQPPHSPRTPRLPPRPTTAPTRGRQGPPSRPLSAAVGTTGSGRAPGAIPRPPTSSATTTSGRHQPRPATAGSSTVNHAAALPGASVGVTTARSAALRSAAASATADDYYDDIREDAESPVRDEHVSLSTTTATPQTSGGGGLRHTVPQQQLHHSLAAGPESNSSNSNRNSFSGSNSRPTSAAASRPMSASRRRV